MPPAQPARYQSLLAADRTYPVRFAIDYPEGPRNRLTVFLRIILALSILAIRRVRVDGAPPCRARVIIAQHHDGSATEYPRPSNPLIRLALMRASIGTPPST